MAKEFTAQSSILDWYKIAFPTDSDMFDEMNEKSTFEDLFNFLDRRKNVYECIFNDGYSDSIVRERVFAKLAEIMNVDYGYIYCKWLES